MTRTHELPSIFGHLDYRAWLNEAWRQLQSQSRSHSYRWFSRRAGLGSPSYLKHVIDGDRNLTDDTIARFARALDLDPHEHAYLRALVHMNQSDTTEQRSAWYEVLSNLAPYRATHQLERHQYEYYARWYCVPIREFVARPDFVEDPAWIAARLRPPIRASEAREALDVLLELGLLRRDAVGRLVQAESLLSTGPELRLIALRRFHQQMLHRAEEAMDAFPLHAREVGGVTLRLSSAQVERLKARLFEVRQEILQLDGADPDAQAVYHFALQLFPLTDQAAATPAPGVEHD